MHWHRKITSGSKVCVHMRASSFQQDFVWRGLMWPGSSHERQNTCGSSTRSRLVLVLSQVKLVSWLGLLQASSS
uniref:Uncharacterized protein n=1 Tax=Zea mays TaxID=4577 RepID=B4FC63_MAIZE|nr:unknown [Zea mays]